LEWNAVLDDQQNAGAVRQSVKQGEQLDDVWFEREVGQTEFCPGAVFGGPELPFRDDVRARVELGIAAAHDDTVDAAEVDPLHEFD
jgi:hypothetical protein